MTLPVIRRLLAGALAIGLLAPMVSSCTKEKPTKVIITVRNPSGGSVLGVNVKLYANPTAPVREPIRLDMQSTTDLSGRAEFDYTDFFKQGQAGFAVLDILCSKDSLVGQGIIKVLEEETNEEIITLRPI